MNINKLLLQAPAFLSVLFFSISLVTPCINVENTHYYGIYIYIFGWFAGEIAWLANPFFSAAVAFWVYKKPIISLIMSSIGLFFAFTAFSFKTYVFDSSSIYKVLGYEIGFYFWIASFFMAIITSIISIIFKPFLIDLSN